MHGPSELSVAIRDYVPSDAIALLQLFRSTVRQVNSRDYSEAQVQAWASDDIDLSAWAARFNDRMAYVAKYGETPVGFVDMTTAGHIDRLFVSAEFQRRGIASALLDQVVTAARMHGLERLTVESSITAKSFFAANHFTAICRQEVACRGERLVNFKMVRVL